MSYTSFNILNISMLYTLTFTLTFIFTLLLYIPYHILNNLINQNLYINQTNILTISYLVYKLYNIFIYVYANISCNLNKPII